MVVHDTLPPRLLALAILTAAGSTIAADIEVEPLADVPAVTSETLFEYLPPEKTGIDLVIPIDEEHPLRRAYHSSSACSAVAIGDLDLDGKPDIFAGNGPRDNALYLQRGSEKFEDVAKSAGVTGGEGAWAVGISLADIDNDGDLDIYVCNYDFPNQLFINQTIDSETGERREGELAFVDQAKEFGLDLADGSVVAAFADYDRDGDLDVYILTHQIYRENGRPSEPIKLFVEDGVLQVDQEWKRWYEVDQHKRGDNGEFLYKEVGRPDYLYRNDGNGKFTDVTEEAGITTERHWGNSSTFWDYNFDGWPDIYVGNDFSSPDFLYRNNGDGTFTEVAEKTLRSSTWFSMGAVQSDFNNDGYIDFLLADMAPKTHYMQKASMASMSARHDNLEFIEGPTQLMHNTMHINTGTNKFLEGAWMADLAETEWTWAIRSGDFDNDGLSDVFFCNGVPRQFNHSDLPDINHQTLVGRTHWEHYANTPERREQNLAYRNKGGFEFEDFSKQWGLDHLGMSYGASLGDLNGDGRLELLTSNLEDPLRVYWNRGTEGNRVVIRLKGTQSNQVGIGSLVTIEMEDGQKQSRQLFPYGGFLDADEPLIHFGLGNAEKVVALTVEWPSGQTQRFTDLAANQRYTVTEPEEAVEKAPAVKSRDPENPWFIESDALKNFPHREEEYDDFDEQPLLPFKLSQLGPGQTWGDIDGDGDLDLLIGGASGQPARMFRNDTGKGSGEILLEPVEIPAFEHDEDFEDMGLAFFDADGDGDVDLYISSGSVEVKRGDDLLLDRLYFNDGKGDFSRAPSIALPDARESNGVVAPADFDRDGDIDLFVGARSIPADFPAAPTSSLLINSSGTFAATTEGLSPTLLTGGMVTSALWTDVDNDSWLDLIVTTEWGPIRLFKNTEGILADVSESHGLIGQGIASHGWWNGIAGADIDNDGDMDYVATNIGRNTLYRASLDSPELIFYGDFDNTGKRSIVEARFLTENGKQICYPRRGFGASTGAMPFIADKMQTFHEYALAPLTGIYPIDKIQSAEQFRANQMDSVILRNDGTGKFTWESLPHLAQISPTYGVVLRDVDLDGFVDCYIVQNHYHSTEEYGEQFASGLSTLMRGTGKQGSDAFETMLPKDSGIEVPGDAKSLAAVDVNGDGRDDFVIGINDDSPQIFINDTAARSTNHPLQIEVKASNQIGTRISVKAGGMPVQVHEISGGGSYLTNVTDRPVFAIPNDLEGEIEIETRWPDGKVQKSQIAAESQSFKLER